MINDTLPFLFLRCYAMYNMLEREGCHGLFLCTVFEYPEIGPLNVTGLANLCMYINVKKLRMKLEDKHLILTFFI